MSTTTASFQYPLIKQEAGNSVWKSMHHKASLYSDNPTAKDKERMKISLLEDMRSIAKLCDECRLHIKDYLRKNPIDDALESKEKLSLYLCQFHNTANQYTNKDIVADCTKILRPKEEAECKDCKVSVPKINIIKKDENNIIGLKESFDKFKEVSIKVFHALCDKYRVPYPEIKFHECPNNPLNSCTSMWIDTQTQEVMERPVVYLHPNIFGLRTIVHEFLHYIKQLSKDTLGGLDEMSIEKEAQSILNQEFPFDEIDKRDLRTTPIVKQEYKTPIPMPLIRNDTPMRLEQFPNSYRIYNKYLYNVKRRDFRHEKENEGGEGEGGGDWILDAFKGQPAEGQSQEGYESVQPIVPEIGGTITKEDKTTNIFSFLDGLYSPFGAFFGMKSSDLNSTTTPIIISNAAQTIIKSQLSPIGSLLLTSLTSLGIFGALIASRRSLMYGDKMVMNLIGSNLLWGSLDYLRPENKQDIILGALDLGTVVSTQQWHLLPQVLLGETLMALVGESTTGGLASPQSAQRNIQRAAMSKGVTGTGSNTIGGTAINKRQNLSDLRAMQKEMELAEQRENPLLTRNIRSGAGRGGNPADIRRGRLGSGQAVNTMPFMGDPNAVMIPSDDAGIEEDEYESSFGMHVADGSNGNSGLDLSNSGVYNRRNTIKDIFGADQSYDNFNDTYYAEDEEYYG